MAASSVEKPLNALACASGPVPSHSAAGDVGAIVEKLEELEQHPAALDVGADSFDDADDDAFAPTEFIDEDDEF